MKKQSESNHLVKLKCDLLIDQLPFEATLKSIIEFTLHYIHIKIFNTKISTSSIYQPDLKKNINNLLYPIFKENTNSINNTNNFSIIYYINYSLINSVKIIKKDKIKIKIINPLSNIKINLLIFNVENVGLIFNKKLSFDSLNQLVFKIKGLIKNENEYLINEYIKLFMLFKDCLDPSKTENDYIEELLLNSYLIGKNYYEKYSKELKKNDKLKDNINMKLSLYDKFFKSTKITNKVNFNEKDIENDDGFIPSTTNNIYSFSNLVNELKVKTSLIIEETINLFFQIIDFSNSLDNSQNKIIFKYTKYDKEEMTQNLLTVKQNEEKYESKRTENMYTYKINKKKLFDININIKNNEEFDINLTASTKTNSDKNNKNKNEYSDMQIEGDLNLNCPRLNYNQNVINQYKKNSNNYYKSNIRSYTPIQTNLSNYRNSKNNIIDLFRKKIIQHKYSDKMLKTSNSNNNMNNKNSQNSNNSNSNHSNETPKFNKWETKKRKGTFDNTDNYKSNNSYNLNSTHNYIVDINKNKKMHSLLQPNTIDDIIFNTSEIIHRKFFGILFDKLIGNIFTIEKDKDNPNFIKLDSFYNYFIYIKALKNILFNENNKEYYVHFLNNFNVYYNTNNGNYSKIIQHKK